MHDDRRRLCTGIGGNRAQAVRAAQPALALPRRVTSFLFEQSPSVLVVGPPLGAIAAPGDDEGLGTVRQAIQAGRGLLAIDGRVAAEVVALQGLGRVQVAPAQAQGELLLGPTLHLILQEPCQERDIGPLAVEGLPMPGVQGGEHAGEAQLLELGAQLMLEFHANPPKTCPNNSPAVRTKARAGAIGGAPPSPSTPSPWSRMRLMVA